MSRKSADAPGVTLADIWSYYDAYNKSVNEISRQISYAGIALIWVFRVSVKDQVHIPGGLFIAGFFLVLCLLLDFLQYIVGSVTYQLYGSYKESRVASGEKFQQPYWLLRPMDLLFFGKIASVLLGYAFIMDYLLSNVSS